MPIESLALVARKDCISMPHGQLLHKTTALGRKEVAVSPNTYRQTQKDRQNEETEDYISNQRIYFKPKNKANPQKKVFMKWG